MTNSEEYELTCPVCRARQILQSPCRRCAADLQLYIKALRSLRISQRQLELASEMKDEAQREVTARYLSWLRPTPHD